LPLYAYFFGIPSIPIAGILLDLELPHWLIVVELNAAWDDGCAPLVNFRVGTIVTPRIVHKIADGEIGTVIRNWSAVYISWSQDNTKRASIVLLQEGSSGIPAVRPAQLRRGRCATPYLRWVQVRRSGKYLD
jgi:hypothetical protein